MKIVYLSPEGVLEVEQGSMRELERRLPKAWIGFAAFQLVQRGSPEALDLDLVVLTSNRILVVELKNWSGDIEYAGGQWVHKGASRKSPVKVTQRKAQVLKDVIREKFPKLKVPYVEPVVMLCHPQCRLKSFPAEERAFVMTLGDFCDAAAEPSKYKARFPDTPPKFAFPSANPLPDRTHYEGLFSLASPAVLERRTVLFGFQQTSTKADYVHPRGIWSEYRAAHVESKRSKALLRKWDFQALGGGGTTPTERATIGLREVRLNEALREQAPDLHADLLEPVGSAVADDVTTNFVEAYRLPDRVERLEELLARRSDMPLEERLVLVQSILSRFSKLHSLGIAHRDITQRTLWVVEPARVILSSFAAARIPEARTVGLHRVELETGAIALPEDVDGDSKATEDGPFARDVFLLGVLAFELLERRELSRLDSVPLFDHEAQLEISGLRGWYQQSMDWDSTRRFSRASEALDAFNKAIAKELGPIVTEEEVLTFKTLASPLNLPMKEALSSASGKSVYISERDGQKVLVKCWPALSYDAKYPARNARLLDFLHQARSLRQASFDAAAEVLDFGIGPFGLMLVTRWEPGQSLEEWMTHSQPPAAKACLALSLLSAVRRLHALGQSHGDIKPSNIAVCDGDDGQPRAVLLDVPDLSADGDSGITVGLFPPHIESAAPQHRDLYAATKLVLDLLADTAFERSHREAERALDLGDVLPPVDLLAETLQSEISPKTETTPRFTLTLKRKGRDAEPAVELEGDNGCFPVGVSTDAATGNLVFFLTGLRRQVVIKYDRRAEQVIDVFAKPVGHEQYVASARRSTFRLYAAVTIDNGESSEATDLTAALYERYLATEQDHEESVAEDVKDPYATGSDQAGLIRPLATTELWAALADTDELNATPITLRPGARRIPDGSGLWLVPFEVEGGVIDFSEDERIELLERGTDIDGSERWYVNGIVSSDIAKDVMRVQPLTSKFNPVEGRTCYLRGALERHASARRVAAMRRVLENAALIPRLPDYFDPNAERAPVRYGVPPIDAFAKYELNAQQEEALRAALELGPVSLLQGPPGTGKTKFIASFVHLVLTQGFARNVLLVSQSHEAVNNALEKVAELAQASDADVSMVRVGLPSMVSKRLRSIQEDSRRQMYRESFDAELKERVRAVGYGMGLPRGYVDEAVQLHVSLGSVLLRIERLRRGALNESKAPGEVSVHVEKLRQVFASIAIEKFGLSVDSGDALPEWFASQLGSLAERHGSPSPDKCGRLQKLIHLSIEFSSVLRNPRSNFTSFLARSSRIVAGTCVGIGKQALGIVDHAYDWVIVDEAARASPMELVVSMQAGKRLLLVGDHLQLPPTYPVEVEEKTAQLLGLSRAEFRRTNNFQRAFSSPYGQQVGRTLLMQYRMAESINFVVSNCFYNGALTVARKPPGVEYEQLPDYLARQVVWVDTADQGRAAFHSDAGTHEGALVNEAEANAVLSIVRGIAKSRAFLEAVRAMDGARNMPIGIITMYAAQRDLIRRKLDQADWATEVRDACTIGTVDSYQGKENRIIILSMVRNDASRGVGFLSDPERINVAMSRAQDRLVVVSSSSMWSGRPTTPMAGVLGKVNELVAKGEALVIPSLELKRSSADA